MPKLLAAAYPDAYALVEDRGGVYFIRPPFGKREKTRATPQAVERAVRLHGFVRETQGSEFASWALLIGHLREQSLEAHRAAGHSLPTAQEVRRLMELVPESTVKGYLERIQTEVLPNRQFSAGRNILTALLKNPVVQSCPELRDRCLCLLESCNQDADAPAGIPAGIRALLKTGFPSISQENWMQFSDMVSTQQQVLLPA
jgi:hypothetical protein